jgi:hypothetical protein
MQLQEKEVRVHGEDYKITRSMTAREGPWVMFRLSQPGMGEQDFYRLQTIVLKCCQRIVYDAVGNKQLLPVVLENNDLDLTLKHNIGAIAELTRLAREFNFDDVFTDDGAAPNRDTSNQQ